MIESTLRGRVLERNNEREEGNDSIRFNDGDSNEIVSSDVQDEKQLE
jgi:hypothetical protein